jgi:hypothetical protein
MKKIVRGSKKSNSRANEKSKISRSLDDMSESLAGKLYHTSYEIDDINKKEADLHRRVVNIRSKTLHSKFVEINKRKKELFLYYSTF